MNMERASGTVDDGTRHTALLFYFKGPDHTMQRECSFPLALYSITAFAERDPEIAAHWDLRIDVFENDTELDQLVWRVLVERPSLVGISCYIWNIETSLKLARLIKLSGSSARIVLGGPQVADAPRILEENTSVDFVVHGEDGEVPFRELLRAVTRGAGSPDLLSVPGLAFRRDGVIEVTPATTIADLGLLPSPYRTARREHLRDTIILETARGCPYSCGFCFWGGTKMRYFDMGRIEDELRFLLALPSVKKLFLIDAELDIDLDHAMAVLELIGKYNTRGIAVSGFFSFGRVSEELIALAKRVNFSFGIGVQSLRRESQDIAGRKFMRESKLDKLLPIIDRYYPKDDVQLQFLIGLPGDDYASVKQNMRWCLERGYTQIAANRLFILPGTRYYRDAVALGIHFDAAGYGEVYETPSFSAQEILRAEALLTAVWSFLKVLRHVSVDFWKSRGIDVIDLCERVGDELLRRGMAFTGRQQNGATSNSKRLAQRQSAESTLLRILEDSLQSDDATRARDLIRYQEFVSRAESRLRTMRAHENLRWAEAALIRPLANEAIQAKFDCDVPAYFEQSRNDPGSIALTEVSGYFLVDSRTNQIRFVRETTTSGSVALALQEFIVQDLLDASGVLSRDIE